MVSLFKQKNSTVVLRLIVFSVIVHIHFFISPPIVVSANSYSLLNIILLPLQSLPSIVISFLYYIIIIVQAVQLNYLLNHSRLFPIVQYTPAMSFVLLSALVPEWNNISASLITVFFILIWLQLLAKTISTQQPTRTLFDCGIATGIIVIFYPTAVIIILIGLIAILILRSFRMNEICLYLVGSIVPLYFLAGILFLNNKLDWLKNLIPHFNFQVYAPTDKSIIIIAFGLILMSTFLGFVTMQNNVGKLLISARKMWIIVVLAFIFLCASLPLLTGKNWTTAMLIAIPFSAAITANFFYYNRNKVLTALLFWLLAIASIFNSFGGFLLFTK